MSTLHHSFILFVEAEVIANEVACELESKYQIQYHNVIDSCSILMSCHRQTGSTKLVISDGQRIGCQPEKLLYTVANKATYCGCLLYRVRRTENRRSDIEPSSPQAAQVRRENEHKK